MFAGGVGNLISLSWACESAILIPGLLAEVIENDCCLTLYLPYIPNDVHYNLCNTPIFRSSDVSTFITWLLLFL